MASKPQRALLLVAEVCLYLTEPSIASSEHIMLTTEGESLTLQCNLTSSQGSHRETYWMKNGLEIAETRSENKNTEYRFVVTGKLCSYCPEFILLLCIHERRVSDLQAEKS